MVKKFDAVIWNLYKHLWIFCCSVEYNMAIKKSSEAALYQSPERCRPLWQGVDKGDSVPLRT